MTIFVLSTYCQITFHHSINLYSIISTRYYNFLVFSNLMEMAFHLFSFASVITSNYKFLHIIVYLYSFYCEPCGLTIFLLVFLIYKSCLYFKVFLTICNIYKMIFNLLPLNFFDSWRLAERKPFPWSNVQKTYSIFWLSAVGTKETNQASFRRWQLWLNISELENKENPEKTRQCQLDKFN